MGPWRDSPYRSLLRRILFVARPKHPSRCSVPGRHLPLPDHRRFWPARARLPHRLPRVHAQLLVGLGAVLLVRVIAHSTLHQQHAAPHGWQYWFHRL